jgi:hypothetical protein
VREPVDPGPDTQPSLEARPDPGPDTQPSAEARPDPPLPMPAPAQPVVVPGLYHNLKRWAFVLIVIGVWIPAALAGLALYYYWFHSLHKTLAVFLVLVLIIVCTVGAQLLAMVEHKPLVTAVSMALLSAPFAATAAAAVLYGAYVFHWIAR